MRILKVTQILTLALFLAIGGLDAMQALAGGWQKPSGQTQQKAEPAKSMVSTIREAQAAPSGTATLTGKISASGAVPEAKKLKMSADPVCMQAHSQDMFSQAVSVKDGKVQYAFVSIIGGISGEFPAPGNPVVLAQIGCMYEPHIFGVQTGQTVEIVNSDSTLHNINCQPKANKKFNIAQPIKGMKTNKTFAEPEKAIPFKCNVHPWMTAYAFVVDHPFFSVSAEDGSYTIANLPAGTYTVEVWHETLGTKTEKVTVSDGESKTVDFTLSV